MSSPSSEPCSQTSNASKRRRIAYELRAIRIDVVVLAVVRDADRLDLELLRIAVAIADDLHLRPDGDDAGLEAGILCARGRRQSNVPHLALVVGDLHRGMRTGQTHVGLHRARDLGLFGLL